MCPSSEQIHDVQPSTPSGAYSRLNELIRLRYSTRDLRLDKQRKAFSLLVGPHQAKFRGRGIEFEEVRGYQAGDDIRSIDWRVTARTGKPHTKMFREERERPVLILVDQSRSMFFGSTTCFKSVMAAHIGALLAWAALQQNDRVGGLVFNGLEKREIRPRRNVKSVLRFLNDLNSLNHLLSKDIPTADQGLNEALEDMRRFARPGSNLFLISDFREFSRKGEEQLHHLSRHCDVSAIQVYDPLEQDLPENGYYSITDGNERFMMYTGDKALRRLYRDRFRQSGEKLASLLGPMGIPLLQLSTRDSAVHYFRSLLGGRQ
jgi:uncharacterized protein (DUF58 family)